MSIFLEREENDLLDEIELDFAFGPRDASAIPLGESSIQGARCKARTRPAAESRQIDRQAAIPTLTNSADTRPTFIKDACRGCFREDPTRPFLSLSPHSRNQQRTLNRPADTRDRVTFGLRSRHRVERKLWTMSSSRAVATVPGPPTSSGGSIDSVRQQILAYVTSVADSEGYCYYFGDFRRHFALLSALSHIPRGLPLLCHSIPISKAYGSNMNAKVLSGRRKVFPVESYPMKTPGWVMRYASRGACYLEPAFGVIIPRPDDAPASEPDAHGVAHRITVLEFLQIVATVGFGQYLSLIKGHLINVSSTGRQEGGGGHPELGYSIVEVVAETTSEPKRTLQRVLSLGAGTKCRFDLLCSARYKEIVVDGAKEGNVEPSYIEYLESIPHYDPSGTVGRRIGRMCFLGIFG
jgi:hypothetical protein